MRKILCWLILSLLFSSVALAGIFVYEPKDKIITFDNVIKLAGTGKNLEILKINDQKIKFSPEGDYSCGLVLRPGKNYVETRALDKNKEHFVEEVRVLGLKSYPDIEALYDGVKHWARN
ncbi:MAG: hypothetical protein ABIA67_01530, partial [Candidatus Margulisiibacteriota bacterium]